MSESSKWLQDLANKIHPMDQIHPPGVERQARKLCDIAKEIERLLAENEQLTLLYDGELRHSESVRQQNRQLQSRIEAMEMVVAL